MSGLIISIVLPIFVGIVWLIVYWKEAHWAAITGYGYLLGIFFTTLIIRFCSWIGLDLSISTISFGLLCAIAPPLISAFFFPEKFTDRHSSQLSSFKVRHWQRFVVTLLSAILIVRMGGIFLEIVWRPLFPWDAWMNWGPKAKLWFELNELAPFVDPVAWRGEASLNGAYTLGNWVAWDYPPTVPLIQLWFALGLGYWRDNYIGIPWFFACSAIGMAFYGQARMLNAKPYVALLFVYLLLCMPFINVHTALAGYADLWMAVFYCLAGMALLNWINTRSRMQFILFVVSSVACVQTKSPGIVWVFTLIPALVLALVPNRYWVRIILTVFVLLAMLFALGGISVDIPSIGVLTVTLDVIEIPGFKVFPLEYHAVLPHFIRNIFLYLNWNIYFYLVIFLLVLVPFVKGLWPHVLLPLSSIIAGCVFIFVVFFFTHRNIEAVDSTTINRALFHMVPFSIFVMFYVYALFNFDHVKQRK